MPELRNCVVLSGPDLVPHRCPRFAWLQDTITAIELAEPCSQLENGAIVLIPGLYNSHTHLGDSALPDGATGLTLEEGFFRPDGDQYRELARLDRDAQRAHVIAHLRYLARTGTVCHLDFREQGAAGAQLLRDASDETGVQSIILSQFDRAPFDTDALERNAAGLPPEQRAELEAMLSIADGVSESTMNDLTDPAWREIRERTTARGRLRAIHCLESPTYRDVSLARTGRGDLVRALDVYDPQVIVHLTVADAAEIALLVQAGKSAVLNPRANAVLGLPLPPVAALLRAGANLLLGTDNAMLNPPSMLAELDFTYKIARSQFGDATSPTPEAVLAMATRNIRPMLGGDHYGYLEKGLPASFVALDFRTPHLRHTRHLLASIVTRTSPADVLATYRAGRELWRADGFEP